jgi:hypothetical protein
VTSSPGLVTDTFHCNGIAFRLNEVSVAVKVLDVDKLRTIAQAAVVPCGGGGGGGGRTKAERLSGI